MPRTGKAMEEWKDYIYEISEPGNFDSLYRAHASHPVQMPKGSAITKTEAAYDHESDAFPARAQTERQSRETITCRKQEEKNWKPSQSAMTTRLLF